MALRQPRNYLLLTVVATTLIIVVLVFLAEGGVRLRQWLKHGQTGTVDSLLQVDPESGLRVPRPGIHSGKIEISPQGFRSPALASEKPDLRLAFLGASTTFCSEVSGNAMTWPALVVQRVRAAFPGRSLDYVNAGIPGYVVDSSAQNWRRRVAPLQPDVVVIYHATNDLSRDSRVLAVKQGLQSTERDRASWLAQHSTLWFLVEKTLAAKVAQFRAVSDAPKLAEIPRELPAAFAQRLERLVRSVQAQGALVVLPTFSYRLRRDQAPDAQLKAAESALYYMPYMSLEGLLSGYEAYNLAIRQVAADTGALLVDGELTIPGDGLHFTDSVHFTDRGSEAMARRVSDALLMSERFKMMATGRGSS